MANLDGRFHHYVINFIASDKTQLRIIDAWIVQSTEILSAMAPIPLCYFLKTRLTSSELREKVSFMFPDGGFIISEVNPLNTDGNFRIDVWQWFLANNNGNVNELKLGSSMALVVDPKPPWPS